MTEAVKIQLDERVRGAAIQVLREHGWDGLTLERVAEASGRARSTLWRQGLGREALVEALLGALHSGTRAERQGQATGRALRSLGVNVDFAPIADVPGSPSSFLYRQGRTWSFAWHTTARMSGWFAIGLGQSGVIASAKHFPGLGLAEGTPTGASSASRPPATSSLPG